MCRLRCDSSTRVERFCRTMGSLGVQSIVYNLCSRVKQRAIGDNEQLSLETCSYSLGKLAKYNGCMHFETSQPSEAILSDQESVVRCQNVNMTIRRGVLGFGGDLVSHRARRYSTPNLPLGYAIVFPLVSLRSENCCKHVDDDGDDDNNKDKDCYSREHAPGVLPINFVAWTR